MATSGWVQFSSDPQLQTAAVPYASSHYYAPQQAAWGQQAYAAATGGHWQAQGWPGAAPQLAAYQQQALVLYDPVGTLNSFGSPQAQQQQQGKPALNPFVPGLAPLPAVPSPKTFVQDDAERALFPNSSKNGRDALSWITQEILSDVRKGALQEATAQRTPMKELRPA